MVKIVNKTCSDNTIYTTVETYAGQHGSTCFQQCEDSGIGPLRNTSSTCWITCFYDTVLGPKAGKPGGETRCSRLPPAPLPPAAPRNKTSFSSRCLVCPSPSQSSSLSMYTTGEIAGMPLSLMIDAWDRPFASVDPAKGGCHSLTPKKHQF